MSDASVKNYDVFVSYAWSTKGENSSPAEGGGAFAREIRARGVS